MKDKNFDTHFGAQLLREIMKTEAIKSRFSDKSENIRFAKQHTIIYIKLLTVLEIGMTNLVAIPAMNNPRNN